MSTATVAWHPDCSLTSVNASVDGGLALATIGAWRRLSSAERLAGQHDRRAGCTAGACLAAQTTSVQGFARRGTAGDSRLDCGGHAAIASVSPVPVATHGQVDLSGRSHHSWRRDTRKRQLWPALLRWGRRGHRPRCHVRHGGLRRCGRTGCQVPAHRQQDRPRVGTREPRAGKGRIRSRHAASRNNLVRDARRRRRPARRRQVCEGC